MKKVKLFVLPLLLLTCFNLYAQEKPQSKPLIMQTMYLNATEANMKINIDSVLRIWKERIMDPNPYFISTKIIRHWWGHDSREIIFIFELKSWDDIEKSFNKRAEIIKEHKGWGTEEEANAFGKLWRSLFVAGSHHSDEIYQLVAE